MYFPPPGPRPRRRPEPIGVDAATMLFLRHEGGIHAVRPASRGPDLHLDMTEPLFDNRRGGERACGNQVDDGGTAWVIRGFRRPDPRMGGDPGSPGNPRDDAGASGAA